MDLNDLLRMASIWCAASGHLSVKDLHSSSAHNPWNLARCAHIIGAAHFSMHWPARSDRAVIASHISVVLSRTPARTHMLGNGGMSASF